jgi:hypothetical protein
VSLLVRDPDLGGEPADRDLEKAVPRAVILRPELVLLSAAALGAGLLHAAFAPGHFAEDWAHGLFFAVVAWLQLLLAVALFARLRRWIFAAGLLNLAVIAVWVVSRTVGVPFGPNAGVPEDVGIPDLISTGLEALLVLGCGMLFLRSGGGRILHLMRGPRWLATAAALGTVGIAVASTIAITPRYAAEHQHGGTAADGHDHSAAGAALVSAWPEGQSPCEKTGPPSSEGQLADDGQGHNHRGPTVQQPIDQATNEVLQQQQALARTAAAAYPTVKDAEAGGYHMSTVYVPCIGAHYTNIGLVGPFDPAKPSELLFDGTKPDSKLIGLSYLIFQPGGNPEGFAGPNDHWHQHNQNGGLCLKGGVVVGGEDMSPADCTARGGQKTILADVWMLHDWVVPGWDCSWGVFAGECPELGGRLGADAWTS